MRKIKFIIKKAFLFIFLISFIAVPVALFYLLKTKNAFLFSMVLTISYIAAIEILFRCIYAIKHKSSYQLIPKVPFRRMYMEPHPYLTYVYKKNFLCQKAMRATYPLNRDKEYIFAELSTNNFRHINGSKGNRDIIIPKPKGLIRINCLGASTTGNYITYNNRVYSYPMELEEALKRYFPKLNIEVNNCGQGGYTTAEILIKFLLNTIDTKPDIIVIYHAYNDLQPSLTDGFQSDYSHSRKNLGEVYYLYQLASKIPYVPLAFYNYVVNNYFSQNIRFTLSSAITRKNADIKNDFKGLETYKRNIQHLVSVCKAYDIKVVLSTFCHYMHAGIKNDPVHIKYHEGVALENEVMRKIAL